MAAIQPDAATCGICLSELAQMRSPIVLPCGHVSCRDCLKHMHDHCKGDETQMKKRLVCPSGCGAKLLHMRKEPWNWASCSFLPQQQPDKEQNAHTATSNKRRLAVGQPKLLTPMQRAACRIEELTTMEPVDVVEVVEAMRTYPRSPAVARQGLAYVQRWLAHHRMDGREQPPDVLKQWLWDRLDEWVKDNESASNATPLLAAVNELLLFDAKEPSPLANRLLDVVQSKHVAALQACVILSNAYLDRAQELAVRRPVAERLLEYIYFNCVQLSSACAALANLLTHCWDEDEKDEGDNLLRRIATALCKCMDESACHSVVCSTLMAARALAEIHAGAEALLHAGVLWRSYHYWRTRADKIVTHTLALWEAMANVPEARVVMRFGEGLHYAVSALATPNKLTNHDVHSLCTMLESLFRGSVAAQELAVGLGVYDKLLTLLRMHTSVVTALCALPCTQKVAEAAEQLVYEVSPQRISACCNVLTLLEHASESLPWQNAAWCRVVRAVAKAVLDARVGKNHIQKATMLFARAVHGA